MRIEPTVERGTAIRLVVNGKPILAFAGETIAAAMLAAGHTRFRSSRNGTPSGLFCNMGTCAECMVTLAVIGRRVRACLTEATDGLEVTTDD